MKTSIALLIVSLSAAGCGGGKSRQAKPAARESSDERTQAPQQGKKLALAGNATAPQIAPDVAGPKEAAAVPKQGHLRVITLAEHTLLASEARAVKRMKAALEKAGYSVDAQAPSPEEKAAAFRHAPADRTAAGEAAAKGSRKATWPGNWQRFERILVLAMHPPKGKKKGSRLPGGIAHVRLISPEQVTPLASMDIDAGTGWNMSGRWLGRWATTLVQSRRLKENSIEGNRIKNSEKAKERKEP